MQIARHAMTVAIGAFVLTGAAAGVAADSGREAWQTAESRFQVKDEIKTEEGIRYACTGVAKGSRDDPRWDKFSTKLVYYLEGGGYLVDVKTHISDADSQQLVFEQRCDGPWLLVGLNPGQYQVTATAKDKAGKVHERGIQLSVDQSGQTEQVINFPGIER